MARGSRICPSANATCSLTSAAGSLMAMTSASTAAAIADLAEREGRLLAHVRVLVLERRDQRRAPSGRHESGRARRPPAAGRRAWVAQREREAVEGRDVAHLPEGEHGLLAHVVVGVLHRGRRVRGRALVAQLAERERRLLAHIAVAVLERRDERLDRPWVAQLAERERRLLAHARVLVFERGDERVDRARVAQLAERVNNAFAHAGVRILQRGQQRVDGTLVAQLRQAVRGLLADIRQTGPSGPARAARRSPDRAAARARASRFPALPCRSP